MNAIKLIEKWDTDENNDQRDNIDALKKYIASLNSKRPFIIQLDAEDRGLEGEKIKLQHVFQFERTIADNITLIEKPEDETDQRNYLAVYLYRNPSLFYYCSFAYDGKINPRIISREVGELELPLDVEGKQVKDNDIIFVFLDDEKNKVDNVLDGICKQKRMKDILITNTPKILVLILLKSSSDKK